MPLTRAMLTDVLVGAYKRCKEECVAVVNAESIEAWASSLPMHVSLPFEVYAPPNPVRVSIPSPIDVQGDYDSREEDCGYSECVVCTLPISVGKRVQGCHAKKHSMHVNCYAVSIAMMPNLARRSCPCSAFSECPVRPLMLTTDPTSVQFALPFIRENSSLPLTLKSGYEAYSPRGDVGEGRENEECLMCGQSVSGHSNVVRPCLVHSLHSHCYVVWRAEDINAKYECPAMLFKTEEECSDKVRYLLEPPEMSFETFFVHKNAIQTVRACILANARTEKAKKAIRVDMTKTMYEARHPASVSRQELQTCTLCGFEVRVGMPVIMSCGAHASHLHCYAYWKNAMPDSDSPCTDFAHTMCT